MSRLMEEESRRIERADGAGVKEMVSDLLRHGVTLMQNEMQLVKAELSEKVSQAGAGATSLVLAAILGNAALIVLLAAATLGLAEVMEGWLAALIVGALAAIVAFVFFAMGRKKLRADNLAPRASVESLREDARIVGGHLR
ncbi:MAG: phage holin family protein [Gammaproteobacteria bacterium]|jgi:hypothetical protein|nr:phage holin family protein [Gammaproteobacteria bacterium]